MPAVISRREESKGNLLLYLLTMKDGLLPVFLMGGAGGSRRFGGATEPLVTGWFHLYAARRDNIYLQSVEVKEDFYKIRQSSQALYSSMKCLAWACLFWYPDSSGRLFKELFSALKMIGESTVLCDWIELVLIWSWLGVIGARPDVTGCSICGMSLKNAYLQSKMSSEGLLCSHCSGSARGDRMTRNSIISLKNLLSLKKKENLLTRV